MKVVILAGGFGTRISEESHLRPKPMIEIGHKPVLWHIMKSYSHYGLNDFIICCGYRGYIIKEYFANYFLHNSNVTFDIQNNKVEVHQNSSEPWRVTLVDTGDETMTGGRIRRIKEYLKNDSDFCLTYGDGLSNVKIDHLIEFHKKHGLKATITAAQAPGRFGALNLDGPRVTSFREKPLGDGNWINGGFFVLNRSAIDYISGDSSVWEKEPLEKLATDGQLQAYHHEGFWQPMDTLRDKLHLEKLWESGKAPWKVW
jgi:glucose-1-phosphate cytidylyltransferase